MRQLKIGYLILCILLDASRYETFHYSIASTYQRPQD
ncbi:hypothetical protein I3843_13G111500 [Carya illinoinensis]|nr:hypothetical protein I3843_13G111500 [Carya illinoinensis]